MNTWNGIATTGLETMIDHDSADDYIIAAREAVKSDEWASVSIAHQVGRDIRDNAGTHYGLHPYAVY